MYNKLNVLVDLVEVHNLDVVVLTEIRMLVDRASGVVARLNFDGYEVVEARGLSAGIILLWRTNFIIVYPLGSTHQEIHALVEVWNFEHKWLLSVVYTSPRCNERELLWEKLEAIVAMTNWPWLVTGDFNELLFQEEKRGGNPISPNKSLRFANMINNCDVHSGTWVSWAQNLLGQTLGELVTTSKKELTKPLWFDHPQFQDVVKLSWEIGNQELILATRDFQTRAKKWNRELFGNIQGSRKRILAKLEGIQKKLALGPSQFLIDLDRNLREEYKIWLERQRST